MSIVWHKGVKGIDMTPSDFVRITSTKAAQLFNLCVALRCLLPF
jgi:hypothetical protein